MSGAAPAAKENGRIGVRGEEYVTAGVTFLAVATDPFENLPVNRAAGRTPVNGDTDVGSPFDAVPFTVPEHLRAFYAGDFKLAGLDGSRRHITQEPAAITSAPDLGDITLTMLFLRRQSRVWLRIHNL